MFVAHGAKPEAKDNDGWTAFRYAASGGNRDLVEFFVAKGADVNTKDALLKWAEQRDLTEIVEILRKHGAKEDKESASTSKQENQSDSNTIEVQKSKKESAGKGK